MGQIQLTISLIMIGLFTVALLGFAINFAVDNNSAISISDDPELLELYTSTSNNVSSFRGNSQDTYESIVETNIESGSEVTSNVGSFAITPGNAVGIVKNILSVTYTKIFGNNSGFGIFFTALIGIIVFTLGLFLYKTLRGQPD